MKFMTTTFLTFLVTTSAFAGGGTVGSDTFSRSVCATKMGLLQEQVELTKFLIDAGAASIADLQNIQLEKILMDYTCHMITIDTFCAKAPPLAQNLVNLKLALYRDGAGDKLEVLESQMKAADIAQICQ